MIPFSEWLPDLPDYRNPGLIEITNAIPEAIGYIPFPSLTKEASGLTGTALGAFAAKDASGNTFLYAGDETTLYSRVDGAWTDVKISGGYSATETWEFVKWGEQVIAVTEGEAPQVITMGGANFANLAGTPPKGRHIAVVADFVVIGNTTTGTVNGTNVVAWSDINDETNWSTNQSDSQELQGNGGHIQKIVGGEYGVIVQENSIWRMDYVGAPLIFQLNEVETNRGTQSPNSVISYGNSVYYLGQDDFYAFDGSGSQPIGTNKITRFFFNDVNTAAMDQVSGAIDVERQLLMWAYPSGSAAKCDRIIMYHWPTGKWSRAEISCQFIFSLLGQGYTLEGLDAVNTSIDAFTVSLDSRAWMGGALLMGAFDQSSLLSTFDGAALDADFTTAEMQLAEGHRSLLTEVRPLIEGSTSTVEIGHRTRLEDSVVWSSPASVNASGFCPVRVNDRYMRFKSVVTGGFDYANGLEIKAVRRGKR